MKNTKDLSFQFNDDSVLKIKEEESSGKAH